MRRRKKRMPKEIIPKGIISKKTAVFAGGVFGMVALAAVSVRAMEFGGFDVEIGTGEYQGNGFQEPSYPWKEEETNPGNVWEGETEGDFSGNTSLPSEGSWNGIGDPWNPGIEGNISGSGDFFQENNRPVFQIPESIPSTLPEQGEPPVWETPREGKEEPGQTALPTLSVTPEPSPFPDPTPSASPTPCASPTPEATVTPIPTPMNTPPAEEPFQYYRKKKKSSERAEESVTEFIFKAPSGVKRAEIRVRAKGWIRILSLRLNGKEVPWHWEKESLVLEEEKIPKASEIQIMLTAEGEVFADSFESGDCA